MFNLINTLTNVCQFVVIRQLSINHNFTNTCTLLRTPVVRKCQMKEPKDQARIHHLKGFCLQQNTLFEQSSLSSRNVSS